MLDFVYEGREGVRLPAGITRIVVPDSIMEVCCNPWESFIDPSTSLSVTTVQLHPQILSLCPRAFRSLRNLRLIENISNLKQLKTIQHKAFHGCWSLVSIDLSGCVMLTCIETAAFMGCSALKSVHLPDSVTKLGSAVFFECESLEDITIPSSLKVIEDRSFYRCSSLKHIHIPANATHIQSEAFYRCKSLESMTFAPDAECALDHLDFGFIKHCDNLKSLSLPPSVTSTNIDAFIGFSNRIQLPWGYFEDGLKKFFPVLTMAFVLLQRAGKRSGISINCMRNEKTPTAADLVNLLILMVLDPTDRAELQYAPDQLMAHETALTQAILLLVQTFPCTLFCNGGDAANDDPVAGPGKAMTENATTISNRSMVSKKRKAR
jgi:BspA type Leucine rich repeat region (6 copies)